MFRQVTILFLNKQLCCFKYDLLYIRKSKQIYLYRILNLVYLHPSNITLHFHFANTWDTENGVAHLAVVPLMM